MYLSPPVFKMLTACPPEVTPVKKRKMENNKRSNANRDPEKRNLHWSLSVEVKREDEDRLHSLRSRWENAKSLLGINRKTSSTQNADLLEKLLDCFEVQKSLVQPVTQTQTPSAIEADSEPQHGRSQPRKRQIYVDTAVDDPCFICTGESLKSLVKYFTSNPQCEFCGGDINFSAMSFTNQGHVCRLEVPCVCSDSVVWLSSGILGHPAKYFVNVR